jgi:hypothetical protein
MFFHEFLSTAKKKKKDLATTQRKPKKQKPFLMPNSTEIVESYESLPPSILWQKWSDYLSMRSKFVHNKAIQYIPQNRMQKQTISLTNDCTNANKRKALLVKGEIIVLMISFIVLYAKGKTEKDEKASIILCSLYISLFYKQWPASHG